MELPSKLLEQFAFNTRPKIEELMLINIDKSTYEEHLSQPLKTNNKQFKIAVTFLTGFNGIFNVTNENNNFYFKKTITDEDGFNKITILLGAYEIGSLNKEIKRIIIDEEHYTEAIYQFTIKPNFSTLGSIIKKSPEGPVFNFIFDDSYRNLLGFHAFILYEEKTYHLILSIFYRLTIFFSKLILDIAQGIIFRGERSGIIHKFTMDVDPGLKDIEKFRGEVQWYKMESKDFISSVRFKLKNENNRFVSFNGQIITFRLSIKKIKRWIHTII